MLGIALGVGAVVVAWVMYKAIVHALPCLLGLGIASVAISSGAGWVGAAITGLAAAVSSLFLLRFLLSKVRSRPVRWAIAVVLSIPSAVLAYNVGIGVLASNVPNELWRQTLAIVVALVISTIAFVRMTQLETGDQ
jgi:hypothetical protein